VPNLTVADWATRRVRNKLISLNLFFGGDRCRDVCRPVGHPPFRRARWTLRMADVADHLMAAIPVMRSDGEYKKRRHF
jgi:hypothetical protein